MRHETTIEIKASRNKVRYKITCGKEKDSFVITRPELQFEDYQDMIDGAKKPMGQVKWPYFITRHCMSLSSRIFQMVDSYELGVDKAFDFKDPIRPELKT